MSRAQSRLPAAVIGEARRLLGLTQRSLGETLGASHRSAVRWEGGASTPGDAQLAKLAALVHPHNRDLARELAAIAQETLESLGIEKPVHAELPASASPVAAKDLVDIVVCAAVEATGSMPDDVRPMLYVVFKRAREIGLTVQAAEDALRERRGGKTAKLPVPARNLDAASNDGPRAADERSGTKAT